MSYEAEHDRMLADTVPGRNGKARRCTSAVASWRLSSAPSPRPAVCTGRPLGEGSRAGCWVVVFSSTAGLARTANEGYLENRNTTLLDARDIVGRPDPFEGVQRCSWADA